MPKFIIHFIKSRKTCKGLCVICKHYKKCKEDLRSLKQISDTPP